MDELLLSSFIHCHPPYFVSRLTQYPSDNLFLILPEYHTCQDLTIRHISFQLNYFSSTGGNFCAENVFLGGFWQNKA